MLQYNSLGYNIMSNLIHIPSHASLPASNCTAPTNEKNNKYLKHLKFANNAKNLILIWSSINL